MSSTLRTWLIVACLLLLLLGPVLVYVSATQYPSISLSGQSITCQRNLLTRLAPYAVQQGQCAVSTSNWFVFSLASSSNMTVTLLFNLTKTDSITQLYNHTGTSFLLDLPATTNGTVVFKMKNYQDVFTKIDGQLAIYTLSYSNLVLPTQVHPYRLYGYGLIVFSLFGIFMLSWNPGRVTTRGLDGFELRWQQFRHRISTFLRHPKNHPRRKEGISGKES